MSDNEQQENGKVSKWRATTAIFMKYCVVSGLQTVLELGLFALLHVFVDRQIANAVAVVCSATFQFIANRNATFKSSSNIVRSAILFVLLWLWNLAFSSTMLALVPSVVGWPAEAVKLCCMACQGVWGWLLSRYVIFK